MRMLKSLTLGAAVAAWLTVTAVTAPGPELTGQAHPVVQEAQTADDYGCYWFPAGSAWVSGRTPDGLCHDGPHGKPYWATGAYSDNDALRADRRLGCWIEPNADPLDGAAEVYCGPVGKAGPDAYGFGPYGFDEFDRWWKSQHPQAAV